MRIHTAEAGQDQVIRYHRRVLVVGPCGHENPLGECAQFIRRFNDHVNAPKNRFVFTISASVSLLLQPNDLLQLFHVSDGVFQIGIGFRSVN